MTHWRREWQITPVILLQEQHKKAKRYDTKIRAPPQKKEGVQHREEQRAITNSSRKNEAAGPKWKQRSVGMCLVVEIMSNAVKKNTTWELGMLGP